jgi:hypothetical protein
MQERFDPVPLTTNRLFRDLRFTTGVLRVPFCATTTRRALEVFREEFETSVVQLKTEAKLGGRLFYRFLSNGPSDLTRRIQDARLIARERTPFLALQDEVLATFPRASRAGVDFEAESGLTKIWTFVGRVPLAEVLRMRALPPGIQAHTDFLLRHELQDVCFVACDCRKRTLNVYFCWDLEQRTERWLQKMAAATGEKPLGADLVEDILGAQKVFGTVGLTFHWERSQLQRWCIYAPMVPYGQLLSPRVRLPKLPAFLERFRNTAPSLNECPDYVLGWSFGGVGAYLKMEKTYARDCAYCFATQMDVDLARPEPAALRR